jgi:hypothetical protein
VLLLKYDGQNFHFNPHQGDRHEIVQHPVPQECSQILLRRRMLQGQLVLRSRLRQGRRLLRLGVLRTGGRQNLLR